MIVNKSVKETNKIEKIFKNIKSAKENDNSNNVTYCENMRFFFKSSLSPSDQSSLSSSNKPQLTFNILEPTINQYVKQISDSLPSTTIKSVDESDLEFVAYAELLTKKVTEVFKKNKYPILITSAARPALVGGKAVIKISTDYVNNLDFNQKVILEVVEDPTTIFFDPSAKKVSKSDANYVVEEFCLTEEEIKDKFKDVNFSDSMFCNSVTSGISIVYGSASEDRKYAIFNYYEYEYDKKKLYLLEDGSTVDSKEEAEKGKVVETRNIKEPRVVCHIVLGDQIISTHELNTEYLPFYQLTGCQYNIEGENFLKSFIESAMDAQRAKNLIANEFFSEAFTQYKSMYALAIEQQLKETTDVLLNPQTKHLLFYKALVPGPDGKTILMPPPKITPPSVIPPEYMQMFESMDRTIELILGSFQSTLNEKEMSGTALYNLSQFINGMMTPFVNNLLSMLDDVTRCILSAFKKLNGSETYQQDGGKEEEEKKEYQFEFEYDVRQFEIYIDPGVNYKLQQEATLERILKLAQVSPSFAQWLNSNEGVSLLLENMDLNNKAEVITKFEAFMQQLESQPKQPDPKSIEAHAKLLEAQSRQQELQLKEKELAASIENDNNSLMLDMHKLDQIKKIEKDKIALNATKVQAENYKTVLNQKSD